ncbi:hypothetical protein Gotri_015800, partial [Gossypium trilobum]|nr:hypothetical protein [Gossypium trilobum]
LDGGEGSTSSEETRNATERYLKEVTKTFEDQQEKTDVAGVVERVKELFKGHNNLLKGFNFFLPVGDEITIDKDEPPLETMAGFREILDFIRVVKVDALLSKDYPDLFVEFIRYLPPT